MLKYMLDTNIVIYVMKKRPLYMKDIFERHQGQMCISTVTLGELIFGAERSRKVEQNLSVIEGFIALVDVLEFDSKAAWHFGNIRSTLYKKGQPIGPYDMLIAAHARAHGLILVTNNVAEFHRVEGLLIENWVLP